MCRVLVGLFAGGALFGQSTAFDRLQQEAARTKALLTAKESLVDGGADVTALHAALRDWIESKLPQTLGPTGADFHNLEAALLGELREAELSILESASDDRGFGYVGLKFQWLPELPDSLVVITSVAVGCGSDQAFYLYQFHSGRRVRAVEDHPQGYWGFTDAELKLSDPDSQGRRLLLAQYRSVQCASAWMVMAYSVRRLGAQVSSSELRLNDQHLFWLGPEPEFVVKPEELIIEFLDAGVDGGVHNRTRIHRYAFAQDVQRLDPVAFQPQDFAEEWLTRPWSEMETRSAGGTREWHQRLHGDPLWAEYSGVIPCMSQGRWLIALDIRRTGDKEWSDPPTTYFLVRDSGSYRYRMEAVSASAPAGCLGAGFASEKHPWLSTTELKELR